MFRGISFGEILTEVTFIRPVAFMCFFIISCICVCVFGTGGVIFCVYTNLLWSYFNLI